MAKGALIKHIIIDVKTKGGKEANKTLGNLSRSYDDLLPKQAKEVKVLRSLAKASAMAASGYQSLIKAQKDSSNSAMERSNIQLSKSISSLEHSVGSLSDMIGANMDALEGNIRTTAKNTAAMGKGEKQVKRTDKAIEKMNRTGRQQAKTFSSMARSGGSLTIMYAGLAANLYLMNTAFQILNKSMDSARFDQLIKPQLVKEFGAELGAVADQMVDFGLSFDDATRKAARSSTLGLDTTQMSQIVEIAKKASVVLGRDFAESLDRLTLGIAKQEKELLDEFGIIVSLSEAQQQYATSIGKTIKQLSASERQQAFANAVTAEGTEKYKKFNVALTETEKLLRDVQNGWQNLLKGTAKGNGILSLMTKTILMSAKGLTMLGRELSGTDDYSLIYNKLEAATKGYNEALKEGNPEVIAKTTAELVRLGNAFYYMNKGTPEWLTFLKTTDSKSFDKVKETAENAHNGIFKVDQALIDLSKRVKGSSKGVIEAWNKANANFVNKNPFTGIISELDTYVGLMEEVETNSSRLSAETLKHFDAMKNSLRLTKEEALELKTAFNDYYKLNSLGGLSAETTDKGFAARAQNTQADPSKMIAERELVTINMKLAAAEKLNASEDEIFKLTESRYIQEEKILSLQQAQTQSLLENIQGLQGLSGLQTNFLEGFSVFNELNDLATNSSKSLTEILSTDLQAFSDFTIGMANVAGSIYKTLSDDKIKGFDREIAAEKRKDGKSKESLAKIKKLEAKKIKEKAKADKAQVGMSTAVGIVNAYRDLPFPVAIGASVALAALGAMQIGNIDKAANGSISALSSSSGSNMKISSGNRDNSIDVSKAASAGEYSFLSGGMGQGSSSNFSVPGRSGGGHSEAGASVRVGERGPEIITPQVPINVASAGESKTSTAPVSINNTYNVQAWDSQDVAGFLQGNSKELRDALEVEMNANSQSLNNVG
jgi:hypothetical protein